MNNFTWIGEIPTKPSIGGSLGQGIAQGMDIGLQQRLLRNSPEYKLAELRVKAESSKQKLMDSLTPDERKFVEAGVPAYLIPGVMEKMFEAMKTEEKIKGGPRREMEEEVLGDVRGATGADRERLLGVRPKSEYEYGEDEIGRVEDLTARKAEAGETVMEKMLKGSQYETNKAQAAYTKEKPTLEREDMQNQFKMNQIRVNAAIYDTNMGYKKALEVQGLSNQFEQEKVYINNFQKTFQEVVKSSDNMGVLSSGKADQLAGLAQSAIAEITNLRGVAGGDTPNTSAIASQTIRHLGSRTINLKDPVQQELVARQIENVVNAFVGSPQDKYYQQKLEIAGGLLNELQSLGFEVDPNTGTIVSPLKAKKSKSPPTIGQRFRNWLRGGE